MQALEFIIIALLVVVLLAIFSLYQKVNAHALKNSEALGEVKKVLIEMHKKRQSEPPATSSERGSGRAMNLEDFDGAPDYSSLDMINHLEQLPASAASYMDSELNEGMDGHMGSDSDPL